MITQLAKQAAIGVRCPQKFDKTYGEEYEILPYVRDAAVENGIDGMSIL